MPFEFNSNSVSLLNAPQSLTFCYVDGREMQRTVISLRSRKNCSNSKNIGAN